MSKPVVFVTGASGNIGFATVSALSSKYRDVVEIRAGVRNPDKAEKLKSLVGVSIVKACMGSTDLADTFKGVDSLYIVTPGTEDRAKLAVLTAESAKTAGVKRVAVVSAPSVEFPDTVFGKQLSEVESKISTLGVPYTIIRLPFFVENLYMFKDSIASQGVITYFQDPAITFPQVVVEDAGKASAAILVDPTKYANKTLEVISNVHNYNDIISEMSRALGREIKYNQLPKDDAAATLEKMGWPAWQAKGVVEMMVVIDSVKFPNEDLSVYESITGEKPTDFKTWMDRHAETFK